MIPMYDEDLTATSLTEDFFHRSVLHGGLYAGEETTRDILSDLIQERKVDGDMFERGLGRLGIKKMTVECVDGTIYEGPVTRVEGSPYRLDGTEVTGFLTKTNAKYGIKKVAFHNPTTVVYWTDGTKTVVTCMDNVKTVEKKAVNGKKRTVKKPMKSDTYSKEMGLAMAIVKKWHGNQGNYNDIFREFAGVEG